MPQREQAFFRVLDNEIIIAYLLEGMTLTPMLLL